MAQEELQTPTRRLLPNVVSVPHRFWRLKQWFVAGLDDAAARLPRRDSRQFISEQGEPAWRAYAAGYERMARDMHAIDL